MLQPATAPPPGFVTVGRAEWAALAGDGRTGLTSEELAPLTAFDPALDLDEVRSVLLPLADLLRLRAVLEMDLRAAQDAFLGREPRVTPYVVGITGSVAAGKSTLAEVLRLLVSRAPERPTVDVVATDSFLLTNDELRARGILHRKGFPESYDWSAMEEFLLGLRLGTPVLDVPVYSHLRYDRVPGEVRTLVEPQLVIVEGVNVLQAPPAGSARLLPSDLVDLRVYVDADEAHLRRWFIERFMAFRTSVFTDPESFYHEYANLTDEQSVDVAERVWRSINGRNLRDHIAPTRVRADLILAKGEDHAVEAVHLRRP
ncbi:MAG: type I pantothenate kinase [Microthrixaceae bacterium]